MRRHSRLECDELIVRGPIVGKFGRDGAVGDGELGLKL